MLGTGPSLGRNAKPDIAKEVALTEAIIPSAFPMVGLNLFGLAAEL